MNIRCLSVPIYEPKKKDETVFRSVWTALLSSYLTSSADGAHMPSPNKPSVSVEEAVCV